MALAKYKVNIGGVEYAVEIISIDPDGVLIRLNGKDYRVTFDEMNLEVERRTIRPKPSGRSMAGVQTDRLQDGALRAPIPGDVVSIDVEEGQLVEAGQALITLESMKMRNHIRAPGAGRVKKIAVRTGQSVAYGEILIEWDEMG